MYIINDTLAPHINQIDVAFHIMIVTKYASGNNLILFAYFTVLNFYGLILQKNAFELYVLFDVPLQVYKIEVI